MKYQAIAKEPVDFALAVFINRKAPSYHQLSSVQLINYEKFRWPG